jgi:hypothetical protein
MSLFRGTGIIIDAKIVDPSGHIYQTGKAREFLRIEISIDDEALASLRSAYPNHYGTLFLPSSFGNKPMKKSACVSITLRFGQQEYEAQLKKPKEREGAWIPAGPVIGKGGFDVKLAGGLANAGFPVQFWTKQLPPPPNPPHTPLPRELYSLRFMVQGKVWDYLSHPA